MFLIKYLILLSFLLQSFVSADQELSPLPEVSKKSSLSTELPLIGKEDTLLEDTLQKTNRPRIAPRPVQGVSVRPPPDGAGYFEISTSLVSGRKKKPITTVIRAKITGYQRPA